MASDTRSQARASSQSPGQRAYEEDCRRKPQYLDGTYRKTWDQLSEAVRGSWESNPTPRECGRG
jgi:hypothetical protein